MRSGLSNVRPAPRRGLALCLAVFCLAGFALRAGLAIAWPTVFRPDEVFQNVEPAYRALTGWGVVTWEWRDGIRSWLFPDALYAVMQAVRLLHWPDAWALPAIWTLLAAVATGAVAVGVAIGWRRFGWAGAVLCGTLCAFWPDLVYFGPKTLGEVQAGNLLVVAAGLATLLPESGRPGAGRLAAIGVLLGLGFDLRFQLAPALALVAIWAGRLDLRGRWLPLALGAAVPLALLGVVDALSWGSPFQSVWKNLEVNWLQGKADSFGVEPARWYFAMFHDFYGPISLPLAFCFVLGAWQAPALAAVAVVVVLSHSAIAHKELSFVYAAIPPAIITVGLGTAWLLRRLARLRRAPRLALAAATIGWGAAMVRVAATERPFEQLPLRAGLQTLWAAAAKQPDLCGLGLYGDPFPWGATPGYVGLRRAVPVYLLDGPEALAQAAPGFNGLITETAAPPGTPGYDRVACAGPACLWHRAGQCTEIPALEINPALARLGQ